jgi:tripeptide aminopeptidase
VRRSPRSELDQPGLPTPDLFTPGHIFHTKLEWNSRRGLDQTVEMLVHLVEVWAEPDVKR